MDAILGDFSVRDNLIFLAGLYWGEGNKKELSLINGDPYLVRSVVKGLKHLGVKEEDIKFNLRIFSDMKSEEITNYWVDFLGVKKEQFGRFEVIEGNGKKKLLYGMCRVRVRKGAHHFKQIMSMIDLMKHAAVVQRIEQGTPKP